jgi:hypothetical protein
MLSLYGPGSNCDGITPVIERISFLCSPPLVSYTKRCSHPQNNPGKLSDQCDRPKIEVYAILPYGKGKKKNERIATQEKGSAARCAQKVTGMRNTHQKSLYPNGSRG